MSTKTFFPSETSLEIVMFFHFFCLLLVDAMRQGAEREEAEREARVRVASKHATLALVYVTGQKRSSGEEKQTKKQTRTPSSSPHHYSVGVHFFFFLTTPGHSEHPRAEREGT